MLSFFSKKKHSPETQPEDVIQGPNGAQSNGDDFIFVEKRDEPEPKPQDAMMYPPMPASFGLPYPGTNYRPPTAASAVGQQPVPYVQDVPFELAPQLCTKGNFELTQLQVDGILAVMTRQMSVEDQDEYNFALERSIQNECY